jgi:hypothetical protein
MLPKVIRLRVYATKYLYFNVFVHPTLKSMYKVNADMKPNFLACCRGKDAWYKVGSKLGHRLGLCGELHFFVKEIGTEIVSHELMHATLNVCHRLRLNPMAQSPGNLIPKGHKEIIADPDEEKACKIHGRMMRQFVDKAYKLGLYDVA